MSEGIRNTSEATILHYCWCPCDGMRPPKPRCSAVAWAVVYLLVNTWERAGEVAVVMAARQWAVLSAPAHCAAAYKNLTSTNNGILGLTNTNTANYPSDRILDHTAPPFVFPARCLAPDTKTEAGTTGSYARLQSWVPQFFVNTFLETAFTF